MNIEVKKSPAITIENCFLYSEQKTALYFITIFLKDLKKYREFGKCTVNSVGYAHDDYIYNAWLTKTGNIKIRLQDNK